MLYEAHTDQVSPATKHKSSSGQKGAETCPIIVRQLYLRVSNELSGYLKNKMGLQDCSPQKGRGGLDKQWFMQNSGRSIFKVLERSATGDMVPFLLGRGKRHANANVVA